MNTSLQKLSRKVCALLISMIFIASYIPKASAVGLTPRLSMKVSDESLQTIRDFDITVAIDKRGNTLQTIDLYLQYDPEYLKVVDQNTATAEPDLPTTSTFGSVTSQDVDNVTGEIHVTLNAGNSNEIVDIITVPLEHYKEGKTEFTISTKTKLLVDGEAIPYRSSKVISGQTITPTHSTRFAHVQSNFLALEDTPVNLEVYIDTPETIEKVELQYQTRNEGIATDPFKKVLMTSSDGKKFTFTIPSFDVRAPGVVYCFQTDTDQTFFVLPRPCSIENAFEIFVLPDDQFNDDAPPELTITPPGGSFTDPVNVSVTANEPATIYCTTNGTEPTQNSPVYQGSFTFANNTTLKCIAEDIVGNVSGVKTEVYNFGGLQVTLVADPDIIAKPGNSTLRWTSSGATTLVIDQGVGDVIANGDKVVFVPKLTTYTITASNGTESKQAQATVRVLNSGPEIDLSASKDSINLGETVILSWVSRNLENEKITPTVGPVGTDENNEEQGTAEVSPNQTTTYTISGFDADGETLTDSVTITVNGKKPPNQADTGPAEMFLWLAPVSIFISSLSLHRRKKK